MCRVIVVKPICEAFVFAPRTTLCPKVFGVERLGFFAIFNALDDRSAIWEQCEFISVDVRFEHERVCLIGLDATGSSFFAIIEKSMDFVPGWVICTAFRPHSVTVELENFPDKYSYSPLLQQGQFPLSNEDCTFMLTNRPLHTSR